MSPNWLLHQCNKMPKNGVEVNYSSENVFRKTGTWLLVVRREATLADLEMSHILVEEGEPIWETVIEITHCPFCGIYLLEADHPKYDDVGYFLHSDYSEWGTKRK